MLLRTVTAAVLLGSAFAIPHERRHGFKHPVPLHYGSGYPGLTGTNGPIATGTAPGEHNQTAHHTIRKTITSDVYVIETLPAHPHGPEDKHKVPGAAGTEQCGQAETVTITAQNTLTVTAGAADAADATSSPPEHVDQPKPVEKLKAAVEPDAKTPCTTDVTITRPKTPATHAPIAAAVNSVTLLQKVPDTNPEKQRENADPSSSSVAAPATKPSASTQASDESEAPAKPAAKPAAKQGGLPFKTKRGLIASGQSMNALASAMGTGKVSWLGNWYSGPPSDLASSLTFVPQLYGAKDANDEWTRNADTAVKNGAKYFLSFGEPAQKHSLTPDQAVDLWMKYMEPYAKQGISIGAPTSLQVSSAYDWLSEFLDKCTECTIGFLGIHWFWTATPDHVDNIKKTLLRYKVLADKQGVPIWLDNFSAVGDIAAQKEVLGGIVPWLDEQDWILAYGYVTPEVGAPGSGPNFVDGDSTTLNELGEYYANL